MDYLNVQQLAAQLTTSVLYDRAGTGWSDAVKLGRTSAQVTDELRDLLRTAGVPGPYLLAGHSLGGLYARHYAQRFPDEVAGLLLLYAKLAASVTRGEHRLVDAGHLTIHLRHPGAVLQAIQDLLGR